MLTKKQRKSILERHLDRIQELEEMQYSLYEKCLKELGVEDKGSWIFDYLFNEWQTTNELLKLLDGQTA